MGLCCGFFFILNYGEKEINIYCLNRQKDCEKQVIFVSASIDKGVWSAIDEIGDS